MRKLWWMVAVLASLVLVASLDAQSKRLSSVATPSVSAPMPALSVQPSIVAEPSALPSATPAQALSTCQVTELYIPSLQPAAGEFNRWNIRPSKPEWNGDTPLPPRDAQLGDPDPEGAFTDAFTLDWHVAGSDADDQVLIISHSSGWRDLPFNSLMTKGGEGEEASRVRPGDLAYLRTACSGEYWLEYEVLPDGVFTSGKPEFRWDSRIVGDGPRPGDLVLLTCLQPESGSSTKVVAIHGHHTGRIVKL